MPYNLLFLIAETLFKRTDYGAMTCSNFYPWNLKCHICQWESRAESYLFNFKVLKCKLWVCGNGHNLFIFLIYGSSEEKYGWLPFLFLSIHSYSFQNKCWNLLYYCISYLLLQNRLPQSQWLKTINTYLTVSVSQEFTSAYLRIFLSSGSEFFMRL